MDILEHIIVTNIFMMLIRKYILLGVADFLVRLSLVESPFDKIARYSIPHFWYSHDVL